MNKVRALNAFWEQFGLDAYDENRVPENATLPYITYETATDSLGNTLRLSASLWYRDTGWGAIEEKASQIAQTIAGNGYWSTPIDNGVLWITKGTPFAQRMSEPSDMLVRRVVLNINAEFLTAY